MQATISGYEVHITYKGVPYTIYTKTGFRGFNIPCTVDYAAGGWKVYVNGELVPVDRVICDLHIEAYNDYY
jgi:hypothetical protein